MNLTNINETIEKLNEEDRNNLIQFPIYINKRVYGDLYAVPISDIHLPILSSVPNSEQILDSEYLNYASIDMFGSFEDDIYGIRNYIKFIYCAEECLSARLEAREKRFNGNGYILLSEVYETLRLRMPNDLLQNQLGITTNDKTWHHIFII